MLRRGSVEVPYEASYRGAARMEKLGTQDCKYPANSKKERISSLVHGVGVFCINAFLSTVMALNPGERLTPK